MSELNKFRNPEDRNNNGLREGNRPRSSSSGSSTSTASILSRSTVLSINKRSSTPSQNTGNHNSNPSTIFEENHQLYRRRASNNNSNNSTNSSLPTQETITNFGNDYNNHFVHTGIFPQIHISNIEAPLIGYPKLQNLHYLKEIHNQKYACKPFGSRVAPKDMPQRIDSWVNQGMNFDVIMIGGCVENVPSYETLISLPIQRITPRPSILFLWVPSPSLEKGRLALESWGFRRSEDIVYLVTDPQSIHFPKWLAVSPDDCLIKTSWHCLMGLKGTLRRSEDSDLINCNVDTDVILETKYDKEKPNIVPEKVYKIIENFSLMSRRLHIIPTYSTLDKPVRVRQGWVMMSPDVILDNFDPQSYMNNNPISGYRVPVDETINDLRPKTPPKSFRK